MSTLTTLTRLAAFHGLQTHTERMPEEGVTILDMWMPYRDGHAWVTITDATEPDDLAVAASTDNDTWQPQRSSNGHGPAEAVAAALTLLGAV